MIKNKIRIFLLAVCMIGMVFFPANLVRAENNILVSHYKTTDSVNIRSGPGEEYEIIGILDGDIPVTVFQEYHEWGKIYHNEETGWVYLGNLYCLDLSVTSGSINDSADTGNSSGENTDAADTADTVDTADGNDSSCDGAEESSVGNGGTESKSLVRRILEKIGLDGKEGPNPMEAEEKDADSAVSDTNSAAADSGDTVSQADSSDSSSTGNEEENVSTDSSSGAAADSDRMTYSGPGWNLLDGIWRYGDSDGLQVYASNTLYQAWKAISNRSSATGFYIAVDCTENEFYIFYGCSGCWVPIEVWQCSTGKWDSPTVKGDFTVLDKGYSFGEPKYSCYYYTEFTTNYLFHSILYDAGTFDVQDGRLGENVSNGCVRLAIENAKWIYDNIPIGTAVYIY